MLPREFKRQLITQRVLVDLKRRSFTGIAFYLVVMFVILLTNGYYLRHPQFSKQFVLFMSGICLLRFLYHFADYLAGEWIEVRLNRAGICFFFGIVILTGLVWGVGYSKFVVQQGEQQNYLLFVVCTTGLCAGGVVAFLPCLWLAVTYGLAMFVPAMLVMAVTGTDPSLLIVSFFYLVYMVGVAIRGNREYWDALENEFLLKEKTRQIELLSQKDGLTGLYNRSFFDERLEYEWSRAIRNRSAISLVICDIDHFKRVNDTYGHLAGDEYLRLMARILKKVVRRETDIVARFGGEEFVILMPDESRENAMALAEQIREQVENTTLNFEGQVVHTTISLGVVRMIPDPFEQSDIIISNADYALYKAKKTGRNRVVSHGETPDFNGYSSGLAKGIVAKRTLPVERAAVPCSLESVANSIVEQVSS